MGLPPRDKAATRPRRVQTFISYHGQAGAAAWRSNQSRGGGEESQGGASSAKGAGYDDQAAHRPAPLTPPLARSVSSRRLARCMVTSRRRPRTRRSSIRSLQRSTLTDRLTLGTSSSDMSAPGSQPAAYRSRASCSSAFSNRQPPSCAGVLCPAMRIRITRLLTTSYLPS